MLTFSSQEASGMDDGSRLTHYTKDNSNKISQTRVKEILNVLQLKCEIHLNILKPVIQVNKKMKQ